MVLTLWFDKPLRTTRRVTKSNNVARNASYATLGFKSSEVPIRVQLEAQIILGILSNDLKAGQRLPSTRELARRHKIHSNTVSAVYRQLASKGWVDYQRGSGVYVKTRGSEEAPEGNLPLDRLIAFFLCLGLDKGQTLPEIQSRLRRWLSLPAPDHFLVIEPDTELRRIIISEIETATGVNVRGVGPGKYAKADLTRAAPIAMLRPSRICVHPYRVTPTDHAALTFRG